MKTSLKEQNLIINITKGIDFMFYFQTSTAALTPLSTDVSTHPFYIFIQIVDTILIFIADAEYFSRHCHWRGVPPKKVSIDIMCMVRCFTQGLVRTFTDTSVRTFTASMVRTFSLTR